MGQNALKRLLTQIVEIEKGFCVFVVKIKEKAEITIDVDEVTLTD